MKWLISFLLALFMASAAFAGENPYIAIVGNDIDFNEFYFSPKHWQFLYDQEDIDVPVCDPFSTVPLKDGQTRVGNTGCEMFKSNFPTNQPEICDANCSRREPNAVITTLSTQGSYFEWWIRLPMTPSGEINICIQCGVLKPNALAGEGCDAVMLCAGETGERIGTGFCTRQYTYPGTNPIKNTALPRITAIAYPGLYNDFSPFHLTAYKNTSDYGYTLVTNQTPKQIKDGPSLQVLDGSCESRVLLKSCMDKCVIAKIPVSNLMNSRGEWEADLVYGDLIQVRLEFGCKDGNPLNPWPDKKCPPCATVKSTVDVYCHSQSTKIMGVGETPF